MCLQTASIQRRSCALAGVGFGKAQLDGRLSGRGRQLTVNLQVYRCRSWAHLPGIDLLAVRRIPFPIVRCQLAAGDTSVGSARIPS